MKRLIVRKIRIFAKKKKKEENIKARNMMFRTSKCELVGLFNLNIIILGTINYHITKIQF